MNKTERAVFGAAYALELQQQRDMHPEPSYSTLTGHDAEYISARQRYEALVGGRALKAANDAVWSMRCVLGES